MPAERLTIQSHKGSYAVSFGRLFSGLENGLKEREHLIIDSKVAALYSEILAPVLQNRSVLKIEATELNKSLERIPNYISSLLQNGVKRGDILVAVGGGILQDIVAFIAAVLFRGLDWKFYPTTLLAQADSCIGSKSSINVAGYKNQIGTFNPPQSIHISTEVLKTLEEVDFCSGIGEIIKVHLIASQKDFEEIEKKYDCLASDSDILLTAIYRSLEIKKELIEKDEFDQNERLVLNYGHSFGHALESATQYEIPHGIAITLGVDMANFFSWQFGFIQEKDFFRGHRLLKKNYRGFENKKIPMESFFASLKKDKKNIGADLSLVLTRGTGDVFRGRFPMDEKFCLLSERFLTEIRGHS